MTLSLAVSYGSRDELVRACRSIAEKLLQVSWIQQASMWKPSMLISMTPCTGC